MGNDHPEARVRAMVGVPVAATVGAASYLVAALWVPDLVAPVCAATVAGASTLALAHRSSPQLRTALALIAALLLVGFAGAWLLEDDVSGGFAWVVAALFLVPLPLIPWLYARTFERGDG